MTRPSANHNHKGAVLLKRGYQVQLPPDAQQGLQFLAGVFGTSAHEMATRLVINGIQISTNKLVAGWITQALLYVGIAMTRVS